MRVKLKSKNTKYYPSIEKELIFISRENEIIISTKDGKEIATLDISIMDAKDENENRIPSNSYWLEFHAKHQSIDNSADVFED